MDLNVNGVRYPYVCIECDARFLTYKMLAEHSLVHQQQNTQTEVEVGEITFNPNKVEVAAMTFNTTKADVAAMTFNPTKAEVSAMTFYPNKADVAAMTFNPNKADVGAMTLNPNKADVGAMTFNPNKVDVGAMTFNPNKVEVGAINFNTTKIEMGAPINFNQAEVEVGEITFNQSEVEIGEITNDGTRHDDEVSDSEEAQLSDGEIPPLSPGEIRPSDDEDEDDEDGEERTYTEVGVPVYSGEGSSTSNGVIVQPVVENEQAPTLEPIFDPDELRTDGPQTLIFKTDLQEPQPQTVAPLVIRKPRPSKKKTPKKNKNVPLFSIKKAELDHARRQGLFPCDICGKAFERNGKLQRHMTVHSEVQQFKCDLCGTGFKRNDSLNEHIKRQTCTRPRPEKNNSSKPKKSTKCSECDKEFASYNHLMRHTREVHLKNYPFGCGICGKSYKRKAELRIHMQKHTICK